MAAEMRVWLHERLALARAATGGPWTAEEGQSPEGGRVHQVAAPPEPSGMRFDFLPIVADRCTDTDSAFMADARTSLPVAAAALLRVLYVDEDELPSRAHDIDYQEGVSDALLHVKKVIAEALKDVAP